MVPVDEVNHGGSREGAGRPPHNPGNPKKKRFPMATDDVWRHVLLVGNGNASLGIEILVRRDLARASEVERAMMAEAREE